MCTLLILRRPHHDWPLILAANRDEIAGRPWRAPGRHWPNRPEVVAGIDLKAGGSWLGLNDFGVVAAVLNRPGSLGPEAHKRSRGELVLEALDHADAIAAARALHDLDGAAFRPFNLLVGDAHDAFWLHSDGSGTVKQHHVPAGASMLTAFDLNSPDSPRIRTYLPRLRAAAAPEPESGDWQSWIALLASREAGEGEGEEGAMYLEPAAGYGTLSSSLLALPAWGRPVWLFAADGARESAFAAVDL